MNQSIKIGDIVWAKVKGYPWWPGMVADIIEEKFKQSILVNFIGDNSQ